MSIINKAAVIGAGTMGAGIAAQFANAGIPVTLLDIVPPDAKRRSVIAESAIERQLKIGGFMHAEQAALVTPGNLEDDLHKLSDADWIVEAVIENADIKRELYRGIEAVRKDDAIVSSNTSTILRARLADGLGTRFAGNFLITHFFNPPRRMRLLEIVAGEDTRPEIAARARLAGDVVLGKTVIDCRDTPGFVANRLGCYWMSVAVIEAIALGLSVEDADAVAGAPFGVPSTGIFGLLDLVGLDLTPGVWGSLYAALPADDLFQRYDLPGNPVISRMIAEGRFGRKAGGGFYRQTERSKPREAIDLVTGVYRPLAPTRLASVAAAGGDIARLCESDDAGGRYAWKVLSRIISYAAHVGPAIAGDVATIDLGMTLGYNWAEGPFRLADRIGVSKIAERLAAEGAVVPELLAAAVRNGGFYQDRTHSHLGTDGRPQHYAPRAGVVRLDGAGLACVTHNSGARLWDMGEGVACLELQTRHKVIDERVIEFIEGVPREMQRGFRALVIGGDDARAFSAGIDPTFLMQLAACGDTQSLAQFIARAQAALRALRGAPFPVVAAASGMALGAGAELLLNCDAVVAHAELAVGLDHAKLGLTPAFGGCTLLLARGLSEPRSGGGPAAVAARMFNLVFEARVSKSALDARALGLLRASDTIVMNQERVLGEACSRARALSDAGYVAPVPALLQLAGRSARAALLNFVYGNRIAGRVSEYDQVLAEALAAVLTGDGADPVVPVTEDRLLELERTAALALAAKPESIARMRHLLATGKPLRN